jgi:hypothetical protein
MALVRRFGAWQIAPKEQKVEGNYLLGHPPNLVGKPKGEKSMVEKRISQKVCMMMYRKSCPHELLAQRTEVKPTLAELKGPMVKGYAHRSRLDAMTLDTCRFLKRRYKALSNGYPVRNGARP